MNRLKDNIIAVLIATPLVFIAVYFVHKVMISISDKKMTPAAVFGLELFIVTFYAATTGLTEIVAAVKTLLSQDPVRAETKTPYHLLLLLGGSLTIAVGVTFLLQRMNL